MRSRKRLSVFVALALAVAPVFEPVAARADDGAKIITPRFAGEVQVTGVPSTNDVLIFDGVKWTSGSGTSSLGTGTNGQLLIGNGSGFTKATLTAGTGITITNGSGTIQIAASSATTLQAAYNGGATIAESGGTGMSFSSATNDASTTLLVAKSPSGIQSGFALDITTSANNTNSGTALAPNAGGLRVTALGSYGLQVRENSTGDTRTLYLISQTNASATIAMQDGSSSSVGGATIGKIRYNTTAAAFQVSCNGAAWTSLSAGGATSLQTAYAGGATIATTGGTAVALSDNSADDGNVLTVTKNPAGSQNGFGILVTMGANSQRAGIVVNSTGAATALVSQVTGTNTSLAANFANSGSNASSVVEIDKQPTTAQGGDGLSIVMGGGGGLTSGTGLRVSMSSSDSTGSAITVDGGNNATVSQPLLYGVQTWNAGGVTFRGVELAFSDTASAAGSTMFRLLGGASGTTEEIAFRKNGGIAVVGSYGTSGQVLTSGGSGPPSWSTVTPTAAACTYRLTSSQAMTNATPTTLSGFTKIYDSNTGGTDFYAGGAPTNFVIPVSGRYLVVGMIFFDGSGSGTLRLVRLNLNGSFYTTIASAAPDSVASPAVGSIVLNLTAGDVLAFAGFQDTGGNLNANTGAIPGANATYVSIASVGDSQGINGNSVTSLAGTANQVAVSASTGAITLSLPSSLVVANTTADTSQVLNISKLPGSNVASFGGDGLVIQMSASNQQVTVGSETAAGASGIILGDTNVTVPPSSFRSFVDILMNGSNRNGFTIWRSQAAADAGANIQGNRSRGTTAAPTNVAAGDVCFTILSGGYNSGISGNGYTHNGYIQFEIDPAGTPGASSMPCAINFAVMPDGSIASPAPIAMSLRSTGFLTMGSSRVIGFSSNSDPTLAVLDGCIYRDSAGVIAFGTTSANAAGTFKSTNGIMLGKLTTYNNVVTAGAGVAPVRANANITAQTGAATVATWHTTADGDFYVSGQVNVTTATLISTSLNCTYTDVSNNPQTVILPITTTAGGFLSGGLITATGTYESTVIHIRAKTGTDVSVVTAAGTFSNVTYSASGSIVATTN